MPPQQWSQFLDKPVGLSQGKIIAFNIDDTSQRTLMDFETLDFEFPVLYAIFAFCLQWLSQILAVVIEVTDFFFQDKLIAPDQPLTILVNINQAVRRVHLDLEELILDGVSGNINLGTAGEPRGRLPKTLSIGPVPQSGNCSHKADSGSLIGIARIPREFQYFCLHFVRATSHPTDLLNLTLLKP